MWDLRCAGLVVEPVFGQQVKQGTPPSFKCLFKEFNPSMFLWIKYLIAKSFKAWGGKSL